jgi:hypothetical protein
MMKCNESHFTASTHLYCCKTDRSNVKGQMVPHGAGGGGGGPMGEIPTP